MILPLSACIILYCFNCNCILRLCDVNSLFFFHLLVLIQPPWLCLFAQLLFFHLHIIFSNVMQFVFFFQQHFPMISSKWFILILKYTNYMSYIFHENIFILLLFFIWFFQKISPLLIIFWTWVFFFNGSQKKIEQMLLFVKAAYWRLFDYLKVHGILFRFFLLCFVP